MGEIILGDCLEVMKNIEDKSISLILTDLPFGMTKNEWDKKLSLDKLWEEYKKIIKDNGAILLFAKGVFAAELIMSNKEMYRYSYVWVRTTLVTTLSLFASISALNWSLYFTASSSSVRLSELSEKASLKACAKSWPINCIVISPRLILEISTSTTAVPSPSSEEIILYSRFLKNSFVNSLSLASSL